MLFKRKFFVFALVLVFALGLSGCGLDEYADATNTALANYNNATGAMTEQLFKINDDNAIVSDPDWQSETLAAADALETAAKAFASLPETPAGFEQVDSLLTDLAFKTTSYTDNVRELVASEDVAIVDTLNDQINEINDLVTQVDSAIGAANQ